MEGIEGGLVRREVRVGRERVWVQEGVQGCEANRDSVCRAVYKALF